MVVAQGAIESQWGTYRIGEYNIFGRKAVAGDKAITVETQECYDGVWQTIVASFKDYDSLDEVIDDWCQLMEWGPYKPHADMYHAGHDIEMFVEGIRGCMLPIPITVER